ncbi:putative ribonuclease H-like domain-containing protein [Tanacetum coccineum]
MVSENNYTRVNYNYSAKKAHPSAHRNIVPRAVLMKTGLRPLNTARPVNIAHPKTTVYSARPMSCFSKSAQSTVKRPYQIKTSLTNKNFSQKVNTAKGSFYTTRPKAVNTTRPNSALVNDVRANQCHLQKEDQGYVDSECSRHMTGNMSYLLNFKEFDEGYMCDKKNNVLFTDTGCFVLSPDSKLANESQVLLKVPRKNNMYNVDIKNIVPKESLTCLVAKATLDESIFTWVFFLASKDETSGIIKSFITQIENLVGIKREFSIAKTPQQNGVAERINKTLIEATRTMLADFKLPTTFWAKSINTVCYVQNRVLVVKPHNKTPYELFRGRTPSLSFMKPFRCHVTILNTLDYLGKFDGKSNDGFFVRYSLNSKAFRVYNIRTRKVKENLHVRFLKDKPIIARDGPKWLFDIDVLTKSMNYVPVVAGTNSNDFVDGSLFDSSSKDASNDEPQPSNDAGKKDDEGGINDQERTKNIPTAPLESTYVDFFADESKLDLSNIATTYPVSTTPNTRIHKDHSLDHVLGDEQFGDEPKKVIQTLKDPSWIEAMQEELINKKDERGIVIRNKVRLVAQGYTQEEGICYDEVLAPVARLRIMLEECRFEDPKFPNKVYKVEKALYGLHQAPRAWYETLSTYLLDNGFLRGQIDKTLFIKRIKSDILLIQVYVDDIIFGSTKKELCTDFENQDKYMDEILKKFGFSAVKTASTPMETSKPLLKDAEAEDVDVHLYRSMIGSLMYLTAFRPDIIFVVCACVRFQVTPKVSYLKSQ